MVASLVMDSHPVRCRVPHFIHVDWLFVFQGLQSARLLLCRSLWDPGLEHAVPPPKVIPAGDSNVVLSFRGLLIEVAVKHDDLRQVA